jgi:hypothetical protein
MTINLLLVIVNTSEEKLVVIPSAAKQAVGNLQKKL